MDEPGEPDASKLQARPALESGAEAASQPCEAKLASPLTKGGPERVRAPQRPHSICGLSRC